jgi:transcriptional regulator with XRE-family HTH domain
MAKTKTRNAIAVIDRMVGDDTELRAMIAREVLNAQVAQLIYEARTKAGLTQKQLAERVGTQQPVIARLEDTSYRGHSLTMLHRIASALGERLEIRFLPQARRAKRSPAARRPAKARAARRA